MDRSVMEGNPHSVIEGMMIAARAIGADEGYVYVRARVSAGREADSPRGAATPRSWACWATIFSAPGTGFRVHVMEGAGAFVCGEETALMALHRRQARHAAAQAALPGPKRPVGQADGDQQRGNAGHACP